jgi:cyclic pyranopterin phosphate synthase
MLDSFGREIDYLRVSVTDRCNLRCVYCMPAEGVKLMRHEDTISFERITLVAGTAAKLGFRKVRLTGGEPLVRKGLPELVSILSGIEGIEVLAMTTNGTLLAPLAEELKGRGLGSVNVSLDTLDSARYAALTRGGRLGDALAGIEAAKAAGLSVKLNVVALEDSTEEDFDALRSFASREGIGIQFIQRYRLCEEKRDGEERERPPTCGTCSRLRLLSDGTLRPCLHSNIAIAIDWDDVEGSIRASVAAKPERGHVCTDLEVGQIGG